MLILSIFYYFQLKQDADTWPSRILEQNDLLPDSPQIVELDNKQAGLFRLFHEGTIQNQELADLTKNSNLMPRRLAEVRRLIGFIGKGVLLGDFLLVSNVW